MENGRKKVVITTNQLIALKECGERKFKLDRLHLIGTNDAKLNINRYASRELANALDCRTMPVVEAVNKFLDDYIKEEWYALDVQYQAALATHKERFERIAKALIPYIGGRKVKDANFTYSFPLTAQYRGVSFNEVTGSVHLLLEEDGCIEAIKIKSGMPVESYKARKAENKPENSMEIACIFAGLKKMFPSVSKFKVSLFYLKSKDDKGTTLAPYEEKQGKNIISVEYDSSEKAVSNVQRIAALCSEGDCANCLSKDVCQFKSAVRRVEKAEKASSSAKGDIQLSEAQEKVVRHIDGPMLVEAVPGAGKTFSLVRRLLYLREQGVNMQNVLMITFTKKARAEILNRVSSAFGDENCTLPTIETFNGFGYNILRENPSLLGNEVKLASDVDKKGITERALNECAKSGIQIANVNYTAMDGDYGLINTAFNWFELIEDIGEDAYRERYADKKDVDNILRVYKRFTEIFDLEGYIGYDDQVDMVNRLFKSHPKLLAIYRNIYRYIMVDEFQDINQQQFDMMYALSREHKNFVAVGDSDQGIYGFRGGSIQFALNFPKYYEGAQVVYMEDNYRCTDHIVSVANALISHNTARYDKEIIAHKEGMPVLFYDGVPADGLGRIVESLETRYRPGEIAVLSRTNKVLERFGRSVQPDGTLTPKDYLIEDAVFLGLLDCLTLYHEGVESDEKVLYRLLILAGADRSLIKKDGTGLYDSLVCNKLIPSLEIVAGENPEERAEDALWNAGVRIYNSFNVIRFGMDVESVLDQLCNSLFSCPEHPVSLALADMADERAIHSIKSLYFLMKNMLRFKDQTRVGYGESMEHLNLLTTHDSKGKEFKCVILYGVDEFAPDEEQRRLLYVGLTRAKEVLVVIQNAMSDNMVSEFKHCCREMHLSAKKGERA